MHVATCRQPSELRDQRPLTVWSSPSWAPDQCSEWSDECFGGRQNEFTEVVRGAFTLPPEPVTTPAEEYSIEFITESVEHVVAVGSQHGLPSIDTEEISFERLLSTWLLCDVTAAPATRMAGENRKASRADKSRTSG